MMRRDLNGKLDGDGIKAGQFIETGVTIGAPIVIGAATTPKAAPQSLKSLGGLPEVEAAQTVNNASKISAAKEVTQISSIQKIQTSELEITHGLTLSKKVFARLKADIKQNGIQTPIKFVIYKGRRFVVDGHHRLAAARQLGIREVPVQEVKLPYLGFKNADDLFSDFPR